MPQRLKRDGDPWAAIDDAPQSLEPLLALHVIRWHWVRGHAGHPENERADALANRGAASVSASKAAGTR